MIPSAGDPVYASVAIPVPVRRLFTYSVPASLRDAVEVGRRVRVPLGGRTVQGTVVAWPAPDPGPDVRTRPVEAVLDDRRRLAPEVLELARFVADYYLCSLGDAIEAASPPDPGPPARLRLVQRIADGPEPGARATAQRALDARLAAAGGEVGLQQLDTAERRAARALADLGRLRFVEREEPGDGAVEPPVPVAPTFEATAGQRRALATLAPAIDSGRFGGFLLFGATGSGKTEVYFRAAARALSRGKGVLYLVPEIGLTPLLIDKVRKRFPGSAVVLHSGLAKRQRYDAWRALRDGRRRFVVGTRSAVFAPVRDLGLIVVDEEQDGSYKQEETPRYNGRDLALVRGRAAGATVVLGSATPSLESFHRAESGRDTRVDLGGRIDDRPMPEVERVDMREEFARHGAVRPLSARLLERLRECVGRGEQALVLRNRRGWSVAAFCPRCGTRIQCERCDVALTWHRGEGKLRCHYCDKSRPMPAECPTCGADDLHLLGEGTEQVEALLAEEIPDARVQRMDRDSIRRKGAHEALLRRFDAGEIDVLVGTQMIAKGHDFPRVTLVGVLSADQSLGIPDFRAGERTFQLLTQVAGRAGRGTRPGRVVVQAYEPDHPLLVQAAAQDYEAFYRRELRYRQALRYPPLTALVRLVIQDAEPFRAREWAGILAGRIRTRGGGRLTVFGPGPAPLARIGGRHREQILARSAGRRRLVRAVDAALEDAAGEVPARAVQVDVDPYSLL